MATKKTEVLSSQGAKRRRQGAKGTGFNLIYQERNSENNQSPEQPPQGQSRILITGGFQHTTGQDARQAQHSLSHQIWTA